MKINEFTTMNDSISIYDFVLRVRKNFLFNSFLLKEYSGSYISVFGDYKNKEHLNSPRTRKLIRTINIKKKIRKISQVMKMIYLRIIILK